MNKKMPWKVKLAIAILSCLYLFLLALSPQVALLLLVVPVFAWSAYQIANYFDN